MKRVACLCLFLVSNVFLTIHKIEQNHICQKLRYPKLGVVSCLLSYITGANKYGCTPEIPEA
jgi:hypothetical protein